MSFLNLKNRFSNGKIHFIGIGGIGMSALALILHKIGCQIQGSDLVSNANTKKLEEIGIKCFIGHEAENITDDVILIVETSIIKETNPEIIKAKSRNIPILKRADILAEIMRDGKGISVAGTHGKTSTTAMIAVLMETAGFDPIVVNGGIINYFGSNAKFGNGDFVVAESDESDGSFVKLPTFIGAINNIEPEHMEFYGNDFELVKDYYKKYAAQIPVDGFLAVCIDDETTKELYPDFKKTKKNIASLSIKNEDADYFAHNIRFEKNGIRFDAKIKKTNQIIKDFFLPAYGIHNVKNALAPISIGLFLGLSEDQIKKGLAAFTGVKRRFTKVGEVDGITIIDDYGHHPTEIQAVFKAAKAVLPENNLIAVFQPHKYSRTRDLFDEFCHSFNDVDVAVIADIYSANQDPIAGINQDSLIDGIKKTGHKNVVKLNGENHLPELIKKIAKSGDMVVCIGAGSISSWANSLPSKLKEI